jgi:hypothetical protein
MSVKPPPSKITESDNVTDFAISIYYKEDGDSIEIVRIDDSHGYTHIDKIYTEKDDIKENMSELTFWEAMDRLMNNWKKYAKYHRQKEE